MAQDDNKDVPERTIDDTMRDTLAAIKAREAAPTEKDTAPASDQQPAQPADQAAAGDQPPAAQQAKAALGNERDPITGKFKGKPGAADPAAKADAQAKPQGQPAEEAKAPQVIQQPAASQPPSSWSDAAKSLWGSLPPVLRQEVLKREGDFQRGIRQYADKAARLDAIDAVVQPHQRQQLTGHYGSFENGVKELLGLSDFAGNNPYEFVAYFMRQRSLDPNQMVQVYQREAARMGQPPQAQNPQQRPMQPQAQPQNSALEQRLQQIENTFQQQTTHAATKTVSAFVQEKDAAGNLLHPHFDDLRNEIADLVEKGKTLAEAYEAAVWASPAHREAMLQAQREAEAAQNRATLEKQAADARRASTVASVTRPNAGASPQKPSNWEETMKQKSEAIQRGTAA